LENKIFYRGGHGAEKRERLWRNQRLRRTTILQAGSVLIEKLSLSRVTRIGRDFEEERRGGLLTQGFTSIVLGNN
jgi:hypothetical protein